MELTASVMESNCSALCMIIVKKILLTTISDLDNSIYNTHSQELIPSFAGPIAKVTVNVGREAILECPVNFLGQYKVSLLTDYLAVVKFKKCSWICVDCDCQIYNKIPHQGQERAK